MKQLREEVLLSRFSNVCVVTDRVGVIASSKADLLFTVEKFAFKPETLTNNTVNKTFFGLKFPGTKYYKKERKLLYQTC